MCANRDDNTKSWLFTMSESLPDEDFTQLIVTMWAIWHARRKVIHEGIFQTPFATHSFITIYLSKLQALKKPVLRPAPQEARPNSWIPSTDGHVKINVDAATPRAGGFGAVSVVARNSEGVYQGASVVIFRNIDDPEVPESLAIREALALANDMYIQQVHVASDCKQAVEAIKGGTASSYAAIVLEIKAQATSLVSCFFSHEFRTSNVEAHRLAKHALTLGVGRHVWLGHPGDLLFVPVNCVTGE